MTPEGLDPAHTRRVFLGTGAAVAAGVVLAGCTPYRVSADNELRGFVALSQVVTGVPDLPRRYAPAYLDALESAGLEMDPKELAHAAGYFRSAGPHTVDGLMRSDAFAEPGAEACARAIAAAWWSGTVTDKAKQTQVITYDDALVFRAMPYARPQAQCLGKTGAWSHRTAAAAA